jgi:hypothetical protein
VDLSVNNLGTLGRWAFVELTEINQIESSFKAKVERAFDDMLARAGGTSSQERPSSAQNPSAAALTGMPPGHFG